MITITMEDNISLWELGAERGVTRFRWLTHPELVERVCVQCLFYHDTVWDIDDPRAPEAPLHPLCACTREPEFDRGTMLGQDPDGEPIIARPPPALRPGEFLNRTLRNMRAADMDKFLGPSRGRMVRSGLVDAAKLVSRAGEIRTVHQILRSVGLSRDELYQHSFRELLALSARRVDRRRRMDRLRRSRRRDGRRRDER